MVHAFSDMQLEGCHVATKDKDVTECLITLDKDHPVTGWQLKPDSYGIKWAHKVKTGTSGEEKKPDVIKPDEKKAAVKKPDDKKR